MTTLESLIEDFADEWDDCAEQQAFMDFVEECRLDDMEWLQATLQTWKDEGALDD